MSKPWQIWAVFLLCLLAVAMAMSWLSFKIIRLDALRETDRIETELARREAELQERVSSALYRMDLMMLPLVAQEAARPHYLYHSFYEIVAPEKTLDDAAEPSSQSPQSLRLPSPILFQPSPFVLLHFEVNANNQITSPQVPEGAEAEEAVSVFQIDPATLQKYQRHIEQAHGIFGYELIAGKCEPVGADRLVNTASRGLIPFAGTSDVTGLPFESFRNPIKIQRSDPFSQLGANPTVNRLDVQRSRGEDRVNREFDQRRGATEDFTQQSVASNSYGAGQGVGFGNGTQIAQSNAAPLVLTNNLENDSTMPVRIGPTKPVWIGEHLIFLRRVERNGESVIQGCWLDWAAIRSALQANVVELLPDVQLEAVTAEMELLSGTAMSTLPVRLVVDRPKLLAMLAIEPPDTPRPNSGATTSLLAAWFGLGLAAIASGMLLQGVLRLSERRAAFVAAVTHELRTPLTTFRMYSEMLADGMVSKEKHQQYANTLKIQADRLSLLVENVLQFARLERGPAKTIRETVLVGELLERFRLRLSERAADDEMQLEYELDKAIASLVIVTQPATVEQILFNLVDNACKYAQSTTDKRIVVSFIMSGRFVQMRVRDFGPGIEKADRKRMFEPFHQTPSATAKAVPGVGLGLALCRRMASSLGGRLFCGDCSGGAMFVLELPSNFTVRKS